MSPNNEGGCMSSIFGQQKTFESAFLDPSLRMIVDKVNAETFNEVKQLLLQKMKESSRFKKEQHLIRLLNIQTAPKLLQFYYSYILASEGKKVA
jgi:hypothetical protein